MYACGMQIHGRLGSLHISNSPNPSVDRSKLFSVLFSASGRSNHSIDALNPPQHTTLDTNVSLSSNCRLFSSLLRLFFDLRSLTFCLPVAYFKTNLSPAGPRRRDYLAPPAVPRLSHFLDDIALNSEYSQNLQASSQSIQRAMEHTQITGREANA